MGDATGMRVTTLGQEDVVGVNRETLEGFAIIRRAKVHFLALQAGQPDGVVQSPLRSGHAGLAHDAAIDNTQLAPGQQALRAVGSLRIAKLPGHPLKPGAARSEPLEKGHIADLGQACERGSGGRLAQPAAFSQVNEHDFEQHARIGNASCSLEGAQLPRFVHPLIGQYCLNNAPILIQTDHFLLAMLRKPLHEISPYWLIRQTKDIS